MQKNSQAYLLSISLLIMSFLIICFLGVVWGLNTDQVSAHQQSSVSVSLTAIDIALPHLNTYIAFTQQVTVSAYSQYQYSQFTYDGSVFCTMHGGGGGGRGINIAYINPDTGDIEDCQNFDTWINHANFVRLRDFISDTVPVGSIIMIAIADEGGFIDPRRADVDTYQCHTPWQDSETEIGYQTLEQLGSELIRDVGYWGSWAMIAIKGQAPLIEAYHNPVYSQPISGWCRAEERIATTIEAVVIINQTDVPTPTHTPTSMLTPTTTSTNIPTPTTTSKNTPTPTNTPANSSTPINTPTNTPVSINTLTSTLTSTPTLTNTSTPTPMDLGQSGHDLFLPSIYR